MALINIFKKLTGLVRGGNKIQSPKSSDSPYIGVKELEEELPRGDKQSKKRNWISAKHKK
jgi:hypothetical protein